MRYNWKRPNDDTLICIYQGLKMQVNYMRSHWAWIVTDENAFPIGGSFLSGQFAESEGAAILLAEFCHYAYIQNPDQYLEVLEAKTSEKFTINLEVTGIRAILVSMILYEHTQKGQYNADEIQTDDEENIELNSLAKSIIDQWGDFNKLFEARV